MSRGAWIVPALAGAELLVSGWRQISPADAFLTIGGSATCVGLLVVAFAVRRLPSWLIIAWLALGLVKAAIILVGTPPGWNLNETVSLAGKSGSSVTRTLDPSFRRGDAPAHLINDYQFNVEVPPRATALLRMQTTAYVSGTGMLTVTSATEGRVVLNGVVLAELAEDQPTQLQLSSQDEQPLQIEFGPAPLPDVALQVRLEGMSALAKPSSPLGGATSLLGRAEAPADLLAVGWAALTMSLLVVRHLRCDGIQTLIAAAVPLPWLLPRLMQWFVGHASLTVFDYGQDWLTYESFARDIRHHSLLMLLGAPPGQASPFYFQALYPYLLALAHVLVGESVHGLVLLQLLGIGAALFLTVIAMGPRLSGLVALLVLGSAGLFNELFNTAEVLFSENAALPFSAFLLFLASRLDTKLRNNTLLAIGIVLGLGVLTRATVWLAVPFLVWIVCNGLHGAPLKTAVGSISVPLVLLAMLVPLRNLVAAGRPVLLPTSGPVNLYMGNVPPNVPPFVVATPQQVIQGDPWQRLARDHDQYLIAVAETAVTQPRVVGERLLAKSEYVLGFAQAMGEPSNPPIAWFAMAPWIVALVGVVSRPKSRLALAALALALTNTAVVILVYPSEYFYKLVLPGLLPLAVWDALAVEALLLELGGARLLPARLHSRHG